MAGNAATSSNLNQDGFPDQRKSESSSPKRPPAVEVSARGGGLASAADTSACVNETTARASSLVQSIPRHAWPGDIRKAPLSRTAKQVWNGLCEHRNKISGLSWPKVSTLAEELSINERTVQRGLEELLIAGWVGTPFGDRGGLYKGIEYHLHPSGIPCLFCSAAVRTIIQRGRNNRTDLCGHGKSAKATKRGDTNVTPGNEGRGDIFDRTGVTKNTPRGDISTAHIRKEPSLMNLL